MSSIIKGSGSSASGSRKSRFIAEIEPTCVRQVRKWLATGFTGCGFAQSFAGKSHLLLGAVDQNVQADAINAIFDLAAAEHLPAIAIFPAIRTEGQLLDQLLLLARNSTRWMLTREVVHGLVTDDVLLGLQWNTADGLQSLPMGFAPFGTMPVTRRAPYVCLATWPGGHENPHRKKFDPNVVDFLDAALPEPLSAAHYKELRDNSVKRTGELMSESHDNPNYYRRVAFRLSATVANRI